MHGKSPYQGGKIFPGYIKLEVVLGAQGLYEFLTVESNDYKVIHVHGNILVYFVFFIQAHLNVWFRLERSKSHFM